MNEDSTIEGSLDRLSQDLLELHAEPVVRSTSIRRSPKIGALAVALARAQGAFTNVSKASTAKVETKKGGEYSYSYADLADFMGMARGPLAANGLAIIQPAAYTEQGVIVVETTLIHGESEQWISNDFHLVPVEHGPQQLGSAITYARKYALCAMLGIVAEQDDDDGNAAQGRAASFQRPPPARPAQPQPQAAPATRQTPAAAAQGPARGGAAAEPPARIRAGVERLEQLAKQLGGDWPARLAKDLDKIGVILDEPEKGALAEQRAAFDQLVELVKIYQAALPPKAAA